MSKVARCCFNGASSWMTGNGGSVIPWRWAVGRVSVRVSLDETASLPKA